MKKIIFPFVTCALLICVSMGYGAINTANADALPSTDLLLIVDGESEKNLLSDLDLDNVEIVTSEYFLTKNNTDYLAYAFSKELASDEQIAENVNFNTSTRIYIYGGLTLQEYAELVNRKANLTLNTLDAENNVTDTINMSFSEDEIENKQEQIICLSTNSNYQSLIVGGNELSDFALEKAIIEHYQETFYNPYAREVVIVNSSFSHRTYLNENYYLNIDYIMYKDNSETDPNYDYFSIVTNAVGVSVNKNNCSQIEVKHQLSNLNNNIYDYAPKDISQAKDVNVTLNCGPSSIIGISFGAGGGPSIDAKYTPDKCLVEWTVKRYWLMGGYFSGDMFSFGSSFRTNQSPVRVDISTFSEYIAHSCSSIKTYWDTIQAEFWY